MGNHRIDAGPLELCQLDVDEMVTVLGGGSPGGRLLAEGYPPSGSRIGLGLHLERARTGARIGPFGWYQMVRRDDGAVVGDINCHAPPDADGVVVVGCDVVAAQRRRGYGSAALHGLSRWLVAHAGVHEVRGEISIGNVASRRMAERAGLRMVGKMGDSWVYRLTATGVEE